MKVSSHSLSPSVVRGIAVLCAAGFLTGAHIAQAGVNVWTSHGPGTPGILALAVDPIAPETIYALTEFGVFKSTDAGDSWSAANTGLPGTSGSCALAIDPTAPRTLYAATADGGFFKSTDGGGSWRGTGNINVPGCPSQILIDPATPGTLYAVWNNLVFKSTDGGGTWSAANTGLANSTFVVLALAIDPTRPGALYAATNGDGVFKSTDGANTWSAANTGLPNFAFVPALALDPTTPGTLYAAASAAPFTTRTRIFKSTDAGDTWSAAVDAGLPIFTDVSALVLDPTAPGTLYAATDGGGVFKSTDAGGSWRAANTGLPHLPSVAALALAHTAPGMLYVTVNVTDPESGSLLFKSTNAGDTWSAAANRGLPGNASVSALALDPTMPGTLYAAGEGPVFKSTDGGGTWNAADTGLDAVFVRALTLAPGAPRALYAGTDGGVFKSTDGGATWNAPKSGLPRINALAVDPTAPDTIYAATGDCNESDGCSGGIFKSIDGANTWNATDTGLPSGAVISMLAVDPNTTATLYAGTLYSGIDHEESGVFKSTDGGGTWVATAFHDQQYVTALAVDPRAGGILYIGTGSPGPGWGLFGGGVFKSTDGGGTWSAANTGLPDSYGVQALAIDPSTPETLYAGTLVNGVFKSADGGATWGAFNAGVPRPFSASVLALDSTTPGRLYAGTGQGVFDIEQVQPSCIGDCSSTSSVAVNDIVTLVNIALGTLQPSACAGGVPSGAEVTVALIIQAVNNALSGCGSGKGVV
jgi:photosystem II stability/assembly factor-like uncharacterized protein